MEHNNKEHTSTTAGANAGTVLDPFIKKQNAKLTQVIQNFYVKISQIILTSRSINEYTIPASQLSLMATKTEHKDQKDHKLHPTPMSPSGTSSTTTSSTSASATHSGSSPHSDLKINKWFNLFISSKDLKHDLKQWKNCNDLSNMATMIIETYVDLHQLTPRQTLVLRSKAGENWVVTKGGGKKQEVVLERWLVEFDTADVSGEIVDELPYIYKQAIIVLRSLFCYSKLMPAFKLKQDLKKLRLQLCNKILDGRNPISSKGRVGLSKPIISTSEPHVDLKYFQPIRTSLGTLHVSMAYRRDCDFIVYDSEELLSTHFKSLDEKSPPPVQVHTSQQTIQHHLQNQLQQQSLQQSLLLLTSLSQLQSRKSDDTFVNDNEKRDSITAGTGTTPTNRVLQLEKRASTSISPVSVNSQIASKEYSESPRRKSSTGSTKHTIQPFKTGSILSSPPPVSHIGSINLPSSVERRISITSNKSNASLAALLRKPSSSSAIPILNSGSSSSPYHAQFNIPRSVALSHGSNLGHDEIDSSGNTPRFSSSFGSKASRRFSNTSVRHSITNSMLATSQGLTGSSSSVPPTSLSGLYVNDDISDFLRMIDDTSDLKLGSFSGSGGTSTSHTNDSMDALNRFQLLRSQHQQLGDSVHASLILQHLQHEHQPQHQYQPQIHPSQRNIGSRSRSPSMQPPILHHSIGSTSPGRKSITHSPTSSLQEQSVYPSITSRLDADLSPTTSVGPTNTSHKAEAVTGTKLESSLMSSRSTGPQDQSLAKAAERLASPGSKRNIHYEDVFDDDDCEDYFLSKVSPGPGTPAHSKDDATRHSEIADAITTNTTTTSAPATTRSAPSHASQSKHPQHPGSHNPYHASATVAEDDDDDLLFAMSDMNLTK